VADGLFDSAERGECRGQQQRAQSALIIESIIPPCCIRHTGPDVREERRAYQRMTKKQDLRLRFGAARRGSSARSGLARRPRPPLPRRTRAGSDLTIGAAGIGLIAFARG
jgi:hypothetical protein